LNNNQHYLTHSPIDIYFKQSKEDFVVTEIPLYEFSGDGEHLIIKFRKKDLTTWMALEIIAKKAGCQVRDIGYAGLKDKNAMTIQYISIHKQYEDKLKNFEHNQIKFLETTYHNNKIKIGHLKGNNFFIRLKRVLIKDKRKVELVLGNIATNGIANYFGYQRFGIDGNNYKKGEAIIAGTLKERSKKLRTMYLNAYQSYKFNKWLSKRIEISKLIQAFEPKQLVDMLDIPLEQLQLMKAQEHPFKIMQGELMSHYPFGRIFCATDLVSEALKFNLRDRVPTGLLTGKKTKKPEDTALKFEEQLIETSSFLDGTRRFAWIFPTDITSEYKEEKNHFELSFTLPKGSYATEVIRELIH
jgi:tRNA pseudouridine13 synthase